MLATRHPSLSAVARFGRFELDLVRGELRRSGVSVHLSPQPLKLLVLLASRAGEVVTREEIRELLWGSETFVDFEQGVNHCIRSIRAVLRDGAHSPQYIETLPRRGYRFLGPPPVSAEPPAALAGRETPLLASAAEPEVKPLSKLASAARRFTLWFERVTERSPPPSARVRLAILPFANLTGDPQRGCLSFGITEELRTQLSQAAGERLLVMSSCSAKALNQAPHPVWAARQEGVNFLLGGSLRSTAERARVNVHLVRVRDETQLWAESYERVLRDELDFQTEIAHTIAEHTRVKLC